MPDGINNWEVGTYRNKWEKKMIGTLAFISGPDLLNLFIVIHIKNQYTTHHLINIKYQAIQTTTLNIYHNL